MSSPRALRPLRRKKTTTAAALVLLLSAMRTVYLHCIHCASAGAASIGRYRERKRPLPACLGIVPRASLLQQGFIARWWSSGQECPAPKGDMGSALQAPPGSPVGRVHCNRRNTCTRNQILHCCYAGGLQLWLFVPVGASGCCDRRWRRRGTSGC
jgi:hypothetical protein